MGKPVKPAKPNPTNPTRSGNPTEETRVKRKAAFLAAFKTLRFQGDACDATDVHRDTVDQWRKEDLDFARAYDGIETNLTEALEKKLMRKAIGEGKDSLGALKIALQARAPQKYSDRLKHEVTNTNAEATLSELIVLFKQKIGNDLCPHCKTKSGLRESIVKELLAYSERLANEQSA